MSAESDDPPAIVASRERPCSSCASALLLDPGGVAIRPAVGSLRNVPDHDRRDELWLHHVSSFSTGTLKGNQAGVVILPGTADAAWMQAVARSAGHAATAFVIRLSTEEFEMRWFSPSAELELCGHGTLAAVHVLAEQGDTGPWLFSTRAGPVTAARRRGTLMVRFDPIELAPAELPGELAAALPPVVRVARGLDHIVELEDASAVSATEPRFALIERLDARGLVVTARADGDYGPADIVSRFFSPQTGIPEDSATGSTHVELLRFWDRRRVIGHQLSDRGGEIHARALDGGVEVGGHVTKLRTERLTIELRK